MTSPLLLLVALTINLLFEATHLPKGNLRFPFKDLKGKFFLGEFGKLLRGIFQNAREDFFEFSGKLKNLLRESHLIVRGHF